VEFFLSGAQRTAAWITDQLQTAQRGYIFLRLNSFPRINSNNRFALVLAKLEGFSVTKEIRPACSLNQRQIISNSGQLSTNHRFVIIVYA
jgi:hypothetical protein